jgi:hypothetical protein
MKFTSAIVAAAAGFASLSSAITVSYDTGYDDRNRALTSVSCSDGANGLITKYHWTTQGNVPRFPYIGGYQGIAGWNSNQVSALNRLTTQLLLTVPCSAALATPLLTTARPSMSLLSTTLPAASTSPKRP